MGLEKSGGKPEEQIVEKIIESANSHGTIGGFRDDLLKILGTEKEFDVETVKEGTVNAYLDGKGQGFGNQNLHFAPGFIDALFNGEFSKKDKDEDKKDEDKKDDEKKEDEKKEDEKKENEELKEELVKEGQLPPEEKDIYGFISKDTGIPIEDLKDEGKYRVELVSISDDNAEDDCPIARYKVYKKLDNKPDDKGDDHSPEDDKPKKTGPKPVDPKKNPDGVHKDDEPKPEDIGKKVGKVKGIVTRGQKINTIDDSDLGIEYPGDGKMLTPIQAAANLIVCHWEDRENKYSPEELEEVRENKFSPEDIEALNSIVDKNEQIIYLAKKIEEDRARIEKTEEQQAFDKMIQEIEEKLPNHLRDIFGEDYQYLNTPMSKNRIHLVSDRDFLAVDCNSKDGVLGVFRSRDGDIYISHSFLEQCGGINGNVLYREPNPNGIGTIEYPEVYFHIIHNVVHEMIHSMSAINYYDIGMKGKKSDYYTRRVGLHRAKINKAGIISAAGGLGFNEGATESLAWEILSRWHKPYKNPELKVYMTYKNYINVIEQMEKTDGVKKIDFWKAMLIRKREKDPDKVEKNTPLYELVTKVNGKNRPSYYDIIMNVMDKGVDTCHIVDFIKTKNINTLKKGLPEDKKLSDIFEQSLLTPDGSDFKAEIKKAYKG